MVPDVQLHLVDIPNYQADTPLQDPIPKPIYEGPEAGKAVRLSCFERRNSPCNLVFGRSLPEVNMLLKQLMTRFGNRSRWIAVLSLLTAAGVWMVARPATSRSVAPPISLAKSSTQTADSARIVSPAEQARVAANYGNLPLSFEPNLGQTDPQVKFLSHNAHFQ
jgi:hypothetical protein